MGVLKLRKGLESLDPDGTAVTIIKDSGTEDKPIDANRVYIDFLSIIYSEGARASVMVNSIYYRLLKIEGRIGEPLPDTPEITTFIQRHGLRGYIARSDVFMAYIKENGVKIATDAVVDYLQKMLFTKINGVNYLFISLDGQVPYGKVKEQRHRRYINPVATELINRNKSPYDRLQIYSPEETLRQLFDKTKYMFDLAGCIKAVKTQEFLERVVAMIKSQLPDPEKVTLSTTPVKNVSDSSDTGSIVSFADEDEKEIFRLVFSKKRYGEGEQIIVREVINDVSMMTNEERDKTGCVFYSPDGDVVFLSLFLKLKLGVPIHTIKDFKLQPTPMEPCIYIDQTKLLKIIVSLFASYFNKIMEVLTGEGVEEEFNAEMVKTLLIDFIYIVSIFGNDFIPILPTVNIWSCMRNIIYIYAYYHATGYIETKTIGFLHKKRVDEDDVHREYIPVWGNIKRFFLVASKFESALVMDSYLAECSDKKKGYLSCVANFGSVFTFYHTYTYCKIANAMYQGLMTAVNTETPHDPATILESVKVDDYLRLNELILFMDKPGGLDTSLNTHRFEENALVATVDPGFLNYFSTIDSKSSALFASEIEPFTEINLSKIGRVTDRFSHLPRSFAFLYFGVHLYHILQIIEAVIARKDDVPTACGLIGDRIHSFKQRVMRTQDMRSEKIEEISGSIEEAITRLRSYNDLASAHKILQKAFEECTSSSDYIFTISNVKTDMVVADMVIVETDIDEQVAKAKRNEYLELLGGTPYDLGNSADRLPYRNTLISSINYIFDFEGYQRHQRLVKERHQASLMKASKVSGVSSESVSVPVRLGLQKDDEDEEEPMVSRSVLARPDSYRGSDRGRGAFRGSVRGSDRGSFRGSYRGSRGGPQRNFSDRSSASSDWRRPEGKDRLDEQHKGGFRRLEGDINATYKVVGDYNRTKELNARKAHRFASLSKNRYITPNLENYDTVYNRYTTEFLHCNVDDTAYIDHICKDYLTTLTWIHDYYVNFNDELVDKTLISTWVFRFGRSPMLRHIKEYLTRDVDHEINMNVHDKAYARTMVPEESYLTAFEKSLFIYPLVVSDFKTPEEVRAYTFVKALNLFSEYAVRFAKTDRGASEVIHSCYAPRAQTAQFNKFIKTKSDNVHSLRSVMVVGLDKAIDTVRYVSDNPVDKILAVVRTVRNMQPVNTIADMTISLRGKPIEKKVIDCRWAPYISKCHLSEEYYPTPSYPELKFTIDVIADLCYRSIAIPPPIKDFLFSDLEAVDTKSGDFKFSYVRSAFGDTIIAMLNMRGGVQVLEDLFAEVYETTVVTVRDKLGEHLKHVARLLVDMEGSEKHAEQCSQLYKDTTTYVKLFYYDILTARLAHPGLVAKVLEHIMKVLDPMLTERSVNVERFGLSLSNIGESLTSTLFKFLMRKYTIHTITAIDIVPEFAKTLESLKEERCS
ncbi:5'-3' exoribonuclease [Yasminevirus sp. GU-2018]|uniref:5'-3' exoribonuclease n=1 Tax=Yasminevirus sp. GU-2018 TaxID=2420051 RepID=A0A5K0U9Y3_9VIRU|nr:5'-3' exoribonuclease [Yasminevirus sp. GU-2018]